VVQQRIELKERLKTTAKCNRNKAQTFKRNCSAFNTQKEQKQLLLISSPIKHRFIAGSTVENIEELNLLFPSYIKGLESILNEAYKNSRFKKVKMKAKIAIYSDWMRNRQGDLAIKKAICYFRKC